MWCSILSISSSISWPNYRVRFLAYIVRIPEQNKMLIREVFKTLMNDDVIN